MTPADLHDLVVFPTVRWLARLTGLPLDTPEARVVLVAISAQEADCRHRCQIGGPARSLWQFEAAGVRGVMKHKASAYHAATVIEALGYVSFGLAGQHLRQMEHNDTLACSMARLLLWTLPQPLPALGDEDGAWAQYLDAWRPGKPHRDRWTASYRAALDAVDPDGAARKVGRLQDA